MRENEQEIRLDHIEYNLCSKQGTNKVTSFIEQLKLVLEATVQEAFQTFEQCTASRKGFNSTYVNVHIIFFVKVKFTKCTPLIYTYLQVIKQYRFFSTSV